MHPNAEVRKALSDLTARLEPALGQPPKDILAVAQTEDNGSLISLRLSKRNWQLVRFALHIATDRLKRRKKGMTTRCEGCSELYPEFNCSGLNVPMLWFCHKCADTHLNQCPEIKAGRAWITKVWVE